MYNYPPAPQQPQRRPPDNGQRGFVLTLVLLCLTAVLVFVLVFYQPWHSWASTADQPTPQPTATVALSPTLAPTPTPVMSSPTPTAVASLDQRIDAYISHMTLTQQIGQLLMLAVYANNYTSALNQPLQQWDIANAIIYNNYNGGPLMPATLSGFTQLVHDVRSHANQSMLITTDEEGGIVDRLAPYYGPSPSPQALTATGNPQQAYAQGKLDAQRLRASGLNADFGPLADIYQGGAVDESRMFGTTSSQVVTYAGAFLDGLQQNGVEGTLKHWPGLGSAPANPDFGLPTITKSQAQLNAVDFSSFRALLSHQPGMIMVTHVIVPAYDASEPASLSPVLINQVLRGQLGYQGVVITDAMDAQGLIQFMQQQGYSDPGKAIAEASIRAILAGNDIIECPIEPDRLATLVTTLTAAVQSGRISQARLDQSLQRIIRLKVQMGLISL